MSKLWEIVNGREVWHAAVHGDAKSQDVTKRLNSSVGKGANRSDFTVEQPSKSHLSQVIMANVN